MRIFKTDLEKFITEANRKTFNPIKFRKRFYRFLYFTSCKTISLLSQTIAAIQTPAALEAIARDEGDVIKSRPDEINLSMRRMAMEKLKAMNLEVSADMENEIIKLENKEKQAREHRHKVREQRAALEKERREACAQGNHNWVSQKVRWGPGYMNGYRCAHCGKTSVPDIRV